MKIKNRLIAVCLIIAAIDRAEATVTLQFDNSPNNVVGGSIQTIQAVPGASITISLQLVSTTETTSAFDVWLSQFSGPQAGIFSITGRDFTGSDFNRPSFTNSTVLSSGDIFSNSQYIGFPNPDGLPDNQIAPQNGPTLGARHTAFPNPPGIHQLSTFTLTLSLSAMPGVYQLQTFNYLGTGWADENFQDHAFDNQAAIRIEVIPEPGLLSLVVVGVLAVLGGNSRRRRKLLQAVCKM